MTSGLQVELDGPAGRDDQPAVRRSAELVDRLRRDVRSRPCRRSATGSRTATGTARRPPGSGCPGWRGRGLDRVEGLPRDHEQERDDERRDEGPDDLGDVVAVGLGRQLVVARLAPVAQDRLDDQAFDDEEDRRRDEEHEGVQVPDLRALVVTASGGKSSGRSARPAPTRSERRGRRAAATPTGDEHRREDRAGRGAVASGGARHPGPQRGHAAPVGAPRRQEQGLERPAAGPRP